MNTPGRAWAEVSMIRYLRFFHSYDFDSFSLLCWNFPSKMPYTDRASFGVTAFDLPNSSSPSPPICSQSNMVSTETRGRQSSRNGAALIPCLGSSLFVGLQLNRCRDLGIPPVHKAPFTSLQKKKNSQDTHNAHTHTLPVIPQHSDSAQDQTLQVVPDWGCLPAIPKHHTHTTQPPVQRKCIICQTVLQKSNEHLQKANSLRFVSRGNSGALYPHLSKLHVPLGGSGSAGQLRLWSQTRPGSDFHPVLSQNSHCVTLYSWLCLAVSFLNCEMGFCRECA